MVYVVFYAASRVERSDLRGRLEAITAGIDAVLDFAEAVQEEVVVGHGLFHQLLEQKHFGTVDDGVDAVAEGFHGGERLERIAEQNKS